MQQSLPRAEQIPQALEGIGRDQLEVSFLGTGAAVPSKYRNVTSIYLDFFKKGSLLLDCGEGSYGQLVRRYGQEGAKQALQKLRCGNKVDLQL